MIKRKPIKRLGVNGWKEVKMHPWLKNFPWNELEQRKLNAPYKPRVIII